MKKKKKEQNWYALRNLVSVTHTHTQKKNLPAEDRLISRDLHK